MNVEIELYHDSCMTEEDWSANPQPMNNFVTVDRLNDHETVVECVHCTTRITVGVTIS